MKRRGREIEEKNTFREKYKFLCRYYEEKYDEQICSKYYEKLKHFGKKKIDLIFEEVINKLKFFPKISEILEIAEHLTPNWLNKDIETKKPNQKEQKYLDEIINELKGGIKNNGN